jgi:hypothetical protein
MRSSMMCVLHLYYWSDVQKDEMGRACGCVGDTRNAFVVGNPQVKRHLA